MNKTDIKATMFGIVFFGLGLVTNTFSIEKVLLMAITVIWTMIAMKDFLESIIPNKLVILLIPCAIVASFVFPEPGLLQRIIGVFVISLPMLIICLIVPSAFGGGDIKLMAVSGFLLGWQMTIMAFIIASILVGVAAIYITLISHVKKKSNQSKHIVLGPALCVGIMKTLIFGNDNEIFYRVFCNALNLQ